MNGVLLQKTISSTVIPTVVDDSNNKNHSHPLFQESLVSALILVNRWLRMVEMLGTLPYSEEVRSPINEMIAW